MAVHTTVTRSCDITGVTTDDVSDYSFRIPQIDAEGDIVVARVNFDATPDAARDFVNKLNKGIAATLKLEGVKVKIVGDASGDSLDQTHIREWARENGFKVADRGRIPADVLAAFNAAQDTDVNGDTE